MPEDPPEIEPGGTEALLHRVQEGADDALGVRSITEPELGHRGAHVEERDRLNGVGRGNVRPGCRPPPRERVDEGRLALPRDGHAGARHRAAWFSGRGDVGTMEGVPDALPLDGPERLTPAPRVGSPEGTDAPEASHGKTGGAGPSPGTAEGGTSRSARGRSRRDQCTVPSGLSDSAAILASSGVEATPSETVRVRPKTLAIAALTAGMSGTETSRRSRRQSTSSTEHTRADGRTVSRPRSPSPLAASRGATERRITALLPPTGNEGRLPLREDHHDGNRGKPVTRAGEPSRETDMSSKTATCSRTDRNPQ